MFPIEIGSDAAFHAAAAAIQRSALVKDLERLGIGRPSTYARIIQTIQDREYVEQIDRRFHATMLGSIVTDKLLQAFPEIMDVKFTAGMEGKLDEIEETDLDWTKLLRDFYGPFHETVDGAGQAGTCGRDGFAIYVREMRRADGVPHQQERFFPGLHTVSECDGIKSVDKQGKPKMQEKSEFKCPNCGREMRKMKGRFGEFLGCTGYMLKKPDGTRECETIINLDKQGNPMPPKPKVMTEIKCEKCGSPMILRDSKRGPFLGCSAFPEMPRDPAGGEDDGRRFEDSGSADSASERRRGQGGENGFEADGKCASRGAERSHGNGHRLRRMRQADGDPNRTPGEIPGLQRIPEVQEHGGGSGEIGGRAWAEWEWKRGNRAGGDDYTAANVGRGCSVAGTS